MSLRFARQLDRLLWNLDLKFTDMSVSMSILDQGNAEILTKSQTHGFPKSYTRLKRPAPAPSWPAPVLLQLVQFSHDQRTYSSFTGL
jgi:hypothetical protein